MGMSTWSGWPALSVQTTLALCRIGLSSTSMHPTTLETPSLSNSSTLSCTTKKSRFPRIRIRARATVLSKTEEPDLTARNSKRTSCATTTASRRKRMKTTATAQVQGVAGSMDILMIRRTVRPLSAVTAAEVPTRTLFQQLHQLLHQYRHPHLQLRLLLWLRRLWLRRLIDLCSSDARGRMQPTMLRSQPLDAAAR